MGKIVKIFLMMSIAFLLVSNGQAGEVTKTRNLDKFFDLSLRIPATVYVTQGGEQCVEIKASNKTQNEIVTEVKNHKLYIRFKTDKFLWQTFEPGNIEIYVNLEDVKGMSVYGIGEIIAPEKINSSFLDLYIMGSGKIQFNELETSVLTTKIKGSGSIEVNNGGNAEVVNCTIDGSGKFLATNFISNNVDVNIVGSGSCKIKTDGKLSGDVKGSGMVYYEGKPQIDENLINSKSVERF